MALFREAVNEIRIVMMVLQKIELEEGTKSNIPENPIVEDSNQENHRTQPASIIRRYASSRIQVSNLRYRIIQTLRRKPHRDHGDLTNYIRNGVSSRINYLQQSDEELIKQDNSYTDQHHQHFTVLID